MRANGMYVSLRVNVFICDMHAYVSVCFGACVSIYMRACLCLFLCAYLSCMYMSVKYKICSLCATFHNYCQLLKFH